MMAARWSFEALAVDQFKNNRYERNFFQNNLEIVRMTGIQISLFAEDKFEECINYSDNLSIGYN